jgi:hypothetical protein
MPPELFDVLAGCPTTKVFKTRDRSTEPALAGLRDRALLTAGRLRGRAAPGRAGRPGRGRRGRRGRACERPGALAAPVEDQPDRRAGRVGGAPPGRHLGPVPGHRPADLAGRRRDHRRPGVPAGVHRQPGDPPGRCIRKASTPWCRPRWPGPGWTRPRTAHTACGPGSSLTPTCAAPRTGRSPTRPGTAAWPAWVVTCASPPPGRTTPIS